jgi:hypothetical protein
VGGQLKPDYGVEPLDWADESRTYFRAYLGHILVRDTEGKLDKGQRYIE